jgi:hypothetical protein
MVGARSTGRAGWAAIVGVVIGAALLAGARDPAPAGSAAHVRSASVVPVSACAGGASAPSQRACARALSSR